MTDTYRLFEELDKWRNVHYRMDAEGIGYCFQHYSSFDEIQDEEFHRLREQFVNTIDALEKLVQNRIKTIEQKVL
jgi:hypothetical protein